MEQYVEMSRAFLSSKTKQVMNDDQVSEVIKSVTLTREIGFPDMS